MTQLVVKWHLPPMDKVELPKDVVLASVGTFTSGSLYIMFGSETIHISEGARVYELKQAFHRQLNYKVDKVKPDDYCCYELPDSYPLKMLTGVMLYVENGHPIYINLRHDNDNLCEMCMLVCNGDCLCPCFPPLTGLCYSRHAQYKRLTWRMDQTPVEQVME